MHASGKSLSFSRLSPHQITRVSTTGDGLFFMGKDEGDYGSLPHFLCITRVTVNLWGKQHHIWCNRWKSHKRQFRCRWKVGVVTKKGFVGGSFAGQRTNPYRMICQPPVDGFRIKTEALQEILPSAPHLRSRLSRYANFQCLR